MPNDTPSMVMYAALKSFGMNNHDAASLLLNTQLTFDGKTLQDRVDESSQLSRRIVRTAPGELPRALFSDFRITCPRLTSTLVDNIALRRFNGNIEDASRYLANEFSITHAVKMAEALAAYDRDEFTYRNMVSYIAHVELSDESGRAVLHAMLFIITGCTGDPQTAALMTIDYATNFFGAEYRTAPTIIGAEAASASGENTINLGLVRVVDGYVKSGSHIHVLNPEGTEIGLLPQAIHCVADVEDDVSRRHAFVAKRGDAWLLWDLGSTNGTRVISGSTGEELALEPNGEPVEVMPTDIICLGEATRFLVMPMLGS